MDERRLQEIQDLIGHKWDLVVLVHLLECPCRFMALADVVRLSGKSISEKMLRQTLNRLRVRGLVQLVPMDERVSAYALTAWGRRIACTMVNLVADGGATSN